ncbi:MAG: YncE family protein [Candidatus Hydrothermarchaeaceae archaeon]
MLKNKSVLVLLILSLAVIGCVQPAEEKKEDVLVPGVYAIVTFGSANKLAIFDTSTYEVVKTIPLSVENDHGLRVSSDNNLIIVTSRNSNAVVIIDVNTLEEVRKISVGEVSHHSTITTDNRYIYTPNIFSDDVSVIDTSTWKEIKRIDFGPDTGPTQVENTPDDRWIWVITEKSNELVLIDAAAMSIKSRWSLPHVPRDLVVSPDGKTVYVTDSTSVLGYDIDGNKKFDLVVGKGERLRGIDISEDGNTLYVNDMNSDELFKVDIPGATWTKIADLSTKAGCGLRVSPDGKQVWTVTQGDDDIYVFNTATDKLIAKMPMYADPHEIDFITVK